MRSHQRIARAVVRGPWSERALSLRITYELGWLTPTGSVVRLARRILQQWPERAEVSTVAAFLRQLPDLTDEPRLSPPPVPPPAPAPARRRIELTAPTIRTREELLRLLWLTEAELDWFADPQLRNSRAPRGPLQHYRYRALTTPGKVRLLEIPKPRLKELQRRLLTHLVSGIPLHPAAHGAVPGRAVATCVQPHVGRPVVVRCDLEGFFSSITRSRVRGLFERLDLAPGLASVLAGLTTAAVPVTVRRTLPGSADVDVRRRTLRRLADPHLPQGSPTSPALANAIAWALDVRLTALAESLGAQYSRYVDDLIFSGSAELPVGFLLAGVRRIVADEDFRLAERKTAVLRSSRRQALLGTVVNSAAAIDRRELDRLRAVLHNCARDGVTTQTRGATVGEFRARLLGQLSWVASIDRVKGARLRASFDALEWP